MIPIHQPAEPPIEFLVGQDLASMIGKPLVPYAPEVIEFLSALSKRLLANPEIRKYPDIAGFAYWCRKANLSRLSRSFDTNQARIGRGVVLHITPSNVPINFAYSLAFGLLAGNTNIVRVSGTAHPQTEIVCSSIAALIADNSHHKIGHRLRIVRYQRNDEITAALSESCNARLLWGGDNTIRHLRSMNTAPRCVDICFADRYSLCILGAEAILSADTQTLETMVAGFYNDVFLLDQNACSSPHLVLWQGQEDRVEQAMDLFWRTVEQHLLGKPVPPAIHALDKYTHLCRTAVLLQGCESVSRQQNLIYRVRLQTLPKGIENHRGRHGFFFESLDNDLDGLKSIVNERYQTITYFGVNQQSILSNVLESGLLGIDRIVPVGQALDISTIWDGYDLIGLLSRIVSTQ